MSRLPDTRQSLILRLRDHADSVAWKQFAELYEPVIYRVARRFGLQDADAVETIQMVLMSVARAVQNWEPAGPASFRTWLLRIVRNKLIDHLRKKSRTAAVSGGSSIHEHLQQYPDPAASISATIEHEYRRELFHQAAMQVQTQVQAATWSAFWLTSMDGINVQKVAASLGTTPGAVHLARSRVLARLRSFVESREREASIENES